MKTKKPTVQPTRRPTASPSIHPSVHPTPMPSVLPTERPVIVGVSIEDLPAHVDVPDHGQVEVDNDILKKTLSDLDSIGHAVADKYHNSDGIVIPVPHVDISSPISGPQMEPPVSTTTPPDIPKFDPQHMLQQPAPLIEADVPDHGQVEVDNDLLKKTVSGLDAAAGSVVDQFHKDDGIVIPIPHVDVTTPDAVPQMEPPIAVAPPAAISEFDPQPSLQKQPQPSPQPEPTEAAAPVTEPQSAIVAEAEPQDAIVIPVPEIIVPESTPVDPTSVVDTVMQPEATPAVRR